MRSRLSLVWKIYAIGLIQIGIIAGGFLFHLHFLRPVDLQKMEAEEEGLIQAVQASAGDRVELGRLAELARREQSLGMQLQREDGEVLFSNWGEPAPPCERPRPSWNDGRHSSRGPGTPERISFWRRLILPPRPAPGVWPRCRSHWVRWGEDSVVRLEVRRLRPPPPPALLSWQIVGIILFVVGVCSLVLARSLALPLRQLSQAAQRFGQGDLAVRSRLVRRDEIGELTQSFNEMADRIVALLQSERELIANVSHELRTPLARIRVALQLAQESEGLAVHEFYREIEDDLDELEQLVSDVLLVASLSAQAKRPPRGLPPLREESVDLVELLRGIVSRIDRTQASRELRLFLPYQSGVEWHGDAVLLRRAIENLLENAFKYSGQEGGRQADTKGKAERLISVELELGILPESVWIEVRDQGIGIDEKDLAHVLRPFFRADRSRTKTTGGMGLGLALVQSVVEAHGGSLTLCSRLGVGTSARVVLPRRSEPPQNPVG